MKRTNLVSNERMIVFISYDLIIHFMNFNCLMFFNLFDTYSIIVHVHREVQVDGHRKHVVCVHDDLGGGGVAL